MQNLADLPSEEVRRLVEAAKQSVRILTDELAAAHARVKLLESTLAAARAIADRGERLLSWRGRAASSTGDIETDLENLALRIEGGQLQAVVNGDGQGAVELVDTLGQRWRVVFSGEVDSFWLPDYSRIPDEQVSGVIVAGAVWDEQWLILGNLGSVGIHVRLFGNPLRIEPMPPRSDASSSPFPERTTP